THPIAPQRIKARAAYQLRRSSSQERNSACYKRAAGGRRKRCLGSWFINVIYVVNLCVRRVKDWRPSVSLAHTKATKVHNGHDLVYERRLRCEALCPPCERIDDQGIRSSAGMLSFASRYFRRLTSVGRRSRSPIS